VGACAIIAARKQCAEHLLTSAPIKRIEAVLMRMLGDDDEGAGLLSDEESAFGSHRRSTNL